MKALIIYDSVFGNTEMDTWPVLTIKGTRSL